MAHVFSKSLDEGHDGESFFRYWLQKRLLFVRMDDVPLGADLAGIDGVIRCEATAQVKWDKMARRTGNVFVELLSDVRRQKPGWAVKCAAEHIFYLLPGLGHVFHIEVAELPTLVESWRHTYPVADAVNEGWVTRGLKIPVREFERVFWYEKDDALRAYRWERTA